jgi:hypothetical protein
LEDAFVFVPGRAIVWYERQEKGPRTVAELEERIAERRARSEEARAEARRVREARRKSPPARALVAGDADTGLGGRRCGSSRPASSGAAASLVVERDGHLSLRVAGPSRELIRLGVVLASAEAAIVAAVEGEAVPVDPERLPDVQVELGGGPAREGCGGPTMTMTRREAAIEAAVELLGEAIGSRSPRL